MSNVNHPPHYNSGNIEVIDAIEDWGFGEGFNRGNAIKYIARAGKKNPETEIEDLEKAVWYLNAEIKRLRVNNLIKSLPDWTSEEISKTLLRFKNDIDNEDEERIWENEVEIE